MKKFILLMLVFLVVFALTLTGCGDNNGSKENTEENPVNEEGEREMIETNPQIEKLVEIITYKGVEFEIVERLDVLWVGCVDYASNNTDESDIAATLKRFQELVGLSVSENERINPDYSAALSINYNIDKPCGVMFAFESYSDKQDERWDLFTQPGGLWLRVAVSEETDSALLGRQNYGLFEYFGVLSAAARENGYRQNPDINIEIEYNCHAGTGPNYAYIPIIAE